MKEKNGPNNQALNANKSSDKVKKYLHRAQYNLLITLKTVFSNKDYLFYAFSFSILFYTFNILVTNYSYIMNNFSISFVIILLIGSVKLLPYFTLFQLILTSLLAGVVFSMSLYLIRRQFAVAVGTGSASMLAAIIAPTCPSCAIGLFSIIGLGGIFSTLPFKGQELGPITLLILLGSAVYLSSKITKNTCKI